MKRSALLACAALLLLAQLPAEARVPAHRGSGILRSPLLWATINVCNTPAHPHTIGIRGSMPGSGVKTEQMFMRFRVQYRDPKGAWSYVSMGADSGFVSVGTATFSARQSGRSFQVAVPPGQRYQLRGVVTFEWRRGKRVVRHAQQGTSASHPTSTGSDPKAFSADVCALT